LVEYSYDPDDRYDRFRDDRRDERRLESMMLDALREIERLSPPPMDRPDRPMRSDPVMEVINDPTITMTKAQKDAINNTRKVMNGNGRIVKAPTGRQTIRSSGQFRSTGIPLPPGKRSRKKTKMDKTMSKCLKMANKRMRKKNGQLRKGKTMADVMRLAHRLCKKS